MYFDTQEVVQTLMLEQMDRGATVELVISGVLTDGTPFEASDCILVVAPGRD
jgi:hypothetical protein